MGNIKKIDVDFDKLIEQLRAQTEVYIFRSDESNWQKNKQVELTTGLYSPYIALKIEISGVDYNAQEMIGELKEIVYWSEEYDPTIITETELPEWHGRKVAIRFNLKNEARIDALQHKLMQVDDDSDFDIPSENELGRLASLPDGVMVLAK